MPPLWSKALAPAYGWCFRCGRLASSLTNLAVLLNFVICSADRQSRFIFTFRAGMIEQRLALPQRSPKPLTVPCTIDAPSLTAEREPATAVSESLWAWVPGRAGVL